MPVVQRRDSRSHLISILTVSDSVLRSGAINRRHKRSSLLNSSSPPLEDAESDLIRQSSSFMVFLKTSTTSGIRCSSVFRRRMKRPWSYCEPKTTISAGIARSLGQPASPLPPQPTADKANIERNPTTSRRESDMIRPLFRYSCYGAVDFSRHTPFQSNPEKMPWRTSFEQYPVRTLNSAAFIWSSGRQLLQSVVTTCEMQIFFGVTKNGKRR